MKTNTSATILAGLAAIGGMQCPVQAKVGPGVAPSFFTDTLIFTDPASRQGHGVNLDHAEIGKDASGRPALRLLPLGGGDWRGGRVEFELAVDPVHPNYVSVRLSGDEESGNVLTLFCDGRQIGYRHLGDVDLLDKGTHARQAPGRLLTNTFPLPESLTRGKSSLHCAIRASGPYFAYGPAFDQFQKPMTVPSRSIFALFSHVDPFVPDLADNGRAAPVVLRPANKAENEEVLAAIKQRINTAIAGLMEDQRRLTQPEIQFLGRAWTVKWTSAYQADAVRDRVLQQLDALYLRYRANPDLAREDPETPNSDWFGFGMVAQALKLMAPALKSQLAGDLMLPTGERVARRQAYGEMFAAARDANLHSRRLYSNQSMIKDTFGIWYDNEALVILDSPLAMPRTQLLPYLYESVGLKEWTGNPDKNGNPTYIVDEPDSRLSMPRGYFETTRQGLTKELGYVGNYGEVPDWVDYIYDATRPTPDAEGDPKIRAQLVKIALARSIFHYPHYDRDGYKAMRIEGNVGWRDTYFPGNIAYVQRVSWESSALRSIVITRDPRLIAYGQIMFDENQFFHEIKVNALSSGLFRQTIGLLDTIEDYEAFKAMAHEKTDARFPMDHGQPDFVFADPENGVIAIKNGEERLYSSLYWRANYGINHLAKVHLMSPATDRTATVRIREEFEPSGLTFTRPNNPHITGFRFTVPYPGDETFTQAQAGEVLPVARLPKGSTYINGQDNPFAGRADYYEMRYGRYLVGMNASKTRSFMLAVPKGRGGWKLLGRECSHKPGQTAIRLAPGMTCVLYQGQ